MRKYKILLILILVFSILTLIVVSWYVYDHSRDRGDGYFYSRNGQTYHGEIYPEQMRTRDELVRSMQKTTMQFYETRHSFGTVSQGSVVKHSFRFKNTGQHPLMINKTDVTCNCTVSGFPQDAIAPGQEGEITLELNTTGIYGFQEKSIVIHSNAIPEAVTLQIDADIK